MPGSDPAAFFDNDVAFLINDVEFSCLTAETARNQL